MPTDLPTDIDATFSDEGDVSRKLHQQHHDSLHTYTNEHDLAADPHPQYVGATEQAFDSARLGGVSAPLYLLTSDANAAYVKQAGGDTITASAATVRPLLIKGAVSQTAPLFDTHDSANNVLTRITAAGALQVRPANGVDNLAIVSISPSVVGDKGLVVRALAGQTANPFEVQVSSGGAMFAIRPDGYIQQSVTTETTATAGVSGATPTQVVGYLPIVINGTSYRLPFYGA